MRSIRLLGVYLAVALLAALAAVPSFAADRAPLKVVASFSILADLAREVGGAAVEVTSLVPAGGDAHVYTPTPADAKAVARAELLIVNGLRYEGWISRLVKAVGFKGQLLVASTGVKIRQTNGGADPHAWQSLPNVMIYVENIRAALVAQRPEHAAATNSRAAAYRERIAALQSETLARLAQIPQAQREVVTGHDAFGYFADAYGVAFIAPRGWSTDSEPSAEAVARIVRQLRQHGAGALLVENRSDPRLMQRIAAEAGIKVGGRLYADALSASGGEADSFLQLFRHNVDTLIDAMGLANSKTPAR